MEYGCLTSNKFKFLSDDETEDPLESLQKAEQAKKDKPVQKKDKKAAAVALKQAPVIAAQSPKAEPEKPQQRQANKENESRENRGGQRGGARGGGGRGRVNFAEKKDVGNRQPEGGQDVMGERFGESRPQRGGGRGGAGGGRGGGGFRGGPRRGYGGRGGSDRPVDTHDSGFRSGGETEDEHRSRGGGGGRAYRGGGRRGFAARGGDRHPGGDRHSGSDRTGVRAQPKRDGHGKGNWGTENDELVGETEPMAPVTDAELVKPEDHQEGEEGAKEADEKKAEEEKAKELTLQEYRALHQKTDQPAFQTRRAGEGQDQKIYSKLVPLKKEEEPEEHEEIIVVRREPREKPLNIEVSFSDTNRSRGGGNSGGVERGYRGGRDRDDYNRGGSRGGDRREFRGDRGGRGGRRNNFAMSDDAFPALGGKA